MKIDVYTKAVMTIIAIALSAIALNPWILPRLAMGSPGVEAAVNSIKSDVSSIAIGLCLNGKIC